MRYHLARRTDSIFSRDSSFVNLLLGGISTLRLPLMRSGAVQPGSSNACSGGAATQANLVRTLGLERQNQHHCVAGPDVWANLAFSDDTKSRQRDGCSR